MHAESSPPFRRLITRRDAIRLSAGALWTLGLWPGWASAQTTTDGSFRFLVVNDTHYMSPECGQWLESAVRQMRQHAGVEFCLLAGDLVEKGQRAHLAAVKEIFSQLKVPFYVQIGNHDYLTQTDRTAYEDLYPRRLNYFFRHRGWQFVGLDTSDGLRFENTYVQPATFHWLDGHLPKLQKARPTVLFTHFPLGAGVKYRPRNADVLLDYFRPFNLRAVFSGHFHGTTERKIGAAMATTNQCCALKRGNHDGTIQKGYFLCTAQPNGEVLREFVAMIVPQPSAESLQQQRQ